MELDAMSRPKEDRPAPPVPPLNLKMCEVDQVIEGELKNHEVDQIVVPNYAEEEYLAELADPYINLPEKYRPKFRKFWPATFSAEDIESPGTSRPKEDRNKKEERVIVIKNDEPFRELSSAYINRTRDEVKLKIVADKKLGDLRAEKCPKRACGVAVLICALALIIPVIALLSHPASKKRSDAQIPSVPSEELVYLPAKGHDMLLIRNYMMYNNGNGTTRGTTREEHAEIVFPPFARGVFVRHCLPRLAAAGVHLDFHGYDHLLTTDLNDDAGFTNQKMPPCHEIFGKPRRCFPCKILNVRGVRRLSLELTGTLPDYVVLNVVPEYWTVTRSGAGVIFAPFLFIVCVAVAVADSRGHCTKKHL